MARIAKVGYWETRNGYGTSMGGTPTVLAVGPKDEPDGPTYTAALAAFKKLRDELEKKKRGALRTVKEAYDAFKEAKGGGLSAGTLQQYRSSLDRFVSRFGDSIPGRILYTDVKRWCEEQVTESVSMRRRQTTAAGNDTGRRAAIRSFFAWMQEEHDIIFNPVRELKCKQGRSRSEAVVLSTEQEKEVLQGATGTFRDFLTVLSLTGARPSEIFSVTRLDFDAARKAIVYLPDETRPADRFRHKNAGKGKVRTILLRGEALEIIRERIKRYPDGALFRSRTGQRFTSSALDKMAKRLSKKVGVPNFILYSFRHTLATRFLLNGGSVAQLAQILGNSIKTLENHYAHLIVNLDALHNALDVAMPLPATEEQPVLKLIS